MRAWLKRGLLVGAVFVAIWMMMAIYWRSVNRLPTPSEIVIYLLVVPLCFVLAVWLIRKSAKGLAGVAAARSAAASATPQASSSSATTSAPNEQTWTLGLLGVAVRASIGSSADEVSAALKANKERPQLDAELTDGAGFPIRTGRVPDLDVSDTSQLIDAWCQSEAAENPVWSEEQLRSLTMASAVVAELGNQLRTHPLLAKYVNAHAVERSSITLPSLQLMPLLPSQWPDANRKIAIEWLMHLIVQRGWPAEKLLLSPLVTNSGAEPLVLIDRLSVHTHRQGLPCLCLMIACESFIGEASIGAWDAAGRLHDAKGQATEAPGEGAVGLLIADIEQTMLMQPENPTAFHRIAHTRREKSADAGGRIDGELLSGLAQAALKNAGATAEQVTFLITDTDQRGSRVTELLNAAYLALPDLDLETDCARVATGCGSAGAVSSLTALALAHNEVATNNSIALCVNNQDPFERVAVVVRPFVPPAVAAATDAAHASLSPT